MPTWWIFAHTNPDVPTSAEADLAPRLGEEAGSVKLANFEKRATDGSVRLELELEVDAGTEQDAADAANAWLADLCRTGRWLDEAGVTIDFDSDDPNADFTEVQDVFSIAGVESRAD